jgi:hypothetical protein
MVMFFGLFDCVLCVVCCVLCIVCCVLCVVCCVCGTRQLVLGVCRWFDLDLNETYIHRL